MHFISYEHAAREPSTTDVLAGEVAPPYLAPIGARASGRTLSANNHVSALINGEQFFPRLIEAIDGAEDYVLLSSYLFSPRAFAARGFAALAGPQKRAVRGGLL